MGRLASKTAATDDAYEEGLVARLKNPKYAAGYIEAVLEDGDGAALLYALRQVVQARGVTRVAGASGLTRVAIYKMLSESGNPRLDSLVKLLQALGLGISVRPLKAA